MHAPPPSPSDDRDLGTSVPHVARGAGRHRPGLTACSLCAGETLGAQDPLPGGQLTRLRRLEADGVARLTLVECLDECERGDVVVARPSPSARGAAAAPVWLERVSGDEATAELRSWLEAGGPGRCPVPAALAELLISRQEPTG